MRLAAARLMPLGTRRNARAIARRRRARSWVACDVPSRWHSGWRLGHSHAPVAPPPVPIPPTPLPAGTTSRTEARRARRPRPMRPPASKQPWSYLRDILCLLPQWPSARPRAWIRSSAPRDAARARETQWRWRPGSYDAPVRRALFLSGAVAGTLLSLSVPAAANGRFPASNQLVFSPNDLNLIVLRTSYGILPSHDNGDSWGFVCEDALGLGAVAVEDPSIGLTANNSLIAGVSVGLNVSTDVGCNWNCHGGPLSARHASPTSRCGPTRLAAPWPSRRT